MFKILVFQFTYYKLNVCYITVIFYVVMMLFSVKIKDNVLLSPFEKTSLETNFDSVGEPTTSYHNDTYMLLIGFVKDIVWIQSVLTFGECFTPVCEIDNIEMSKKLIDSVFINTILYIASKASEESHPLKSMLEYLRKSEYLLNKVITVVIDTVITPDMLKYSAQIKATDEELLQKLMDAIASTGKFRIFKVLC